MMRALLVLHLAFMGDLGKVREGTSSLISILHAHLFDQSNTPTGPPAGQLETNGQHCLWRVNRPKKQHQKRDVCAPVASCAIFCIRAATSTMVRVVGSDTRVTTTLCRARQVGAAATKSASWGGWGAMS